MSPLMRPATIWNYILAVIFFPITIYFLIAKLTFLMIDVSILIINKCWRYSHPPLCEEKNPLHLYRDATVVDATFFPVIAVYNSQLFPLCFWAITWSIGYFLYQEIHKFLIRIWDLVSHVFNAVLRILETIGTKLF